MVSLAGNLGGFEVEATWGTGLGASALMIELRCHGHLPDDLELGPEPGGPRRALNEKDVLTGDPEFDALVWVKGDPTTIVAAFDGGTRRLATRFTQRGAILMQGVLRAPSRLGRSAAPAQVVAAMRSLVELARRLAIQNELAVRLARNANRDPVARVRANCLDQLAERFPRDDGTTRAFRSALSDRDPLVRVTAARHLGAAGRPVLLSIVAKAQTATSTLVMAVQALGAHLPPGVTARILRRSASLRKPHLVRSVLDALPATIDPRVAEEVARFAHSCSTELQVPALTTLGRIGSVALVPRLRALADDRLRPREMRRAAREAIAAIQARAGGTAGELALAEGNAGAISLATSDGRVTLDEHQDRESD